MSSLHLPIMLLLLVLIHSSQDPKHFAKAQVLLLKTPCAALFLHNPLGKTYSYQCCLSIFLLVWLAPPVVNLLLLIPA